MRKKLEKNNNQGFAILFSVTMAAIVLAIALGVANIALKEVKFSTSAKSSADAFFAADVGTECALVNDKSGSAIFKSDSSSHTMQCANKTITVTGTGPWNFSIAGIGTTFKSCAKVIVTKAAASPTGVTTTVNAKGYDTDDPSCGGTFTSRVERELETKYTTGVSIPPINLALSNSAGGTTGATAAQSSTFGDDQYSAADRAIDNNTDGNYLNGVSTNSVSVTNNDSTAWWQIDLGADYTIQSINVFNRTNGSSDRIDGAHIFVAPDGDTNFLADHNFATAQNDATAGNSYDYTITYNAGTNPYNFSFSPPIVGRYIRVQLPGTNYLQLAEVQIWGN